MPSFLDEPIGNIRYFAPAAVKKLARLKIATVRDLLYHFPSRYDDFSDFIPIADAKPDCAATISGEILSAKNIRTFKKRMMITEIVVGDESGEINAVWFNQPYLLNQFQTGRRINLSGKIAPNKKRLCFSNPAYEIADSGRGGSLRQKEPLHTGRLVPVYPETYGLTSRWLRSIIKPLLKFAGRAPDVLPAELRKENNLPDFESAMAQIHFPASVENAASAKRRFAFEELFILQMFMGLNRLKFQRQTAPAVPFDENAAKKFVKTLPFELTGDQKKAAWQIIGDMSQNRPMNRLLEGDVGSGKTIVAAMAAYLAALKNFQTAFMAPTEILSRQHFEKIAPLFAKSGIAAGLLTSSESRIFSNSGEKISRKKFLEKVADGEIKILIGTHALVQKSVRFKNLALAIVDEQHRFGVNHRAALLKNGSGAPPGGTPLVPHLLSMSATPIPRTLGLTIWGDLDLSLIQEMPKGRKNIITKITAPAERSEVYEFIRNEIKNGRQAFVVCPLVEVSEKLSAKSAEGREIKAAKKEQAFLQEKIFPELKIGLLHGRLKPKEKEKTMAEFLNRNLDILATTSVVEVGVDIPNASVMMIEGADRFGLASLHQFRGRVGRGKHQSYCFLMADSPSAQTSKRLKALESAQNGFKLAERDLEIRGPGDFTGIRQSGLPDLAIASLADLRLVEETREAARKILSRDPNLKNYPILKSRLAEFRNRVHLE